MQKTNVRQLAAGFLILAAASCTRGGPAPEPADPMLAMGMHRNGFALLLDVRPEPEFAAKHVAGIAHSEATAEGVRAALGSFKPTSEHPVLVIAETREDSVRIARVLSGAGIPSRATHGWGEWTAAALPFKEGP